MKKSINDIGVDEVKRECLYTPGGNVNSYDLNGKQQGDVSMSF